DLSETIGSLLIEAGQPTADDNPDSSRSRRAGARRTSRPAMARSVPPADPGTAAVLVSDAAATAMPGADSDAFEVQTETAFPLMVDRREAAFASWYELFPRSQGPIPGVHGTFRDVIEHLPRIRDMGFDVLYFPPIHPIGSSNRKGRNNS